jgi:hypothetical protein
MRMKGSFDRQVACYSTLRILPSQPTLATISVGETSLAFWGLTFAMAPTLLKGALSLCEAAPGSELAIS